MAAAQTAVQQFTDNRTHATIFHKTDNRLNDILRWHKKSDIIKLYDIDCYMLFRFQRAEVQFDLFENNRPYIRMYGEVEGVFLDEKQNSLFPNRCDQLDFRKDFQVLSCVNYKTSDNEISTLAANGLYNADYSLQGPAIGKLLEFPCKIDYYAIKNTPITYVEIQNRLDMELSTRKTGYRTLVASFLRYNEQKHNLEAKPTIVQHESRDNTKAIVRQLDNFDSNVIGFKTEPSDLKQSDGVDFIEVAQARIQKKLQDQMAAGNVLQINGDDVSSQVAKTVERINAAKKDQRDKFTGADNENASRVNIATLDEKIEDMGLRMVYAGANAIPIPEVSLQDKPLVEPKPVNVNDVKMDKPVTEVTSTVGSNPVKPEDIKETVDANMDKVHDKMYDAEKTANSIAKTLNRKKMLQERKRSREEQSNAIQQNLINESSVKDINDDAPKHEPVKLPDSVTSADAGPNTKKLANEALKDDMFANETDYDAIIKSVEDPNGKG